jgi:hypothetical protein
MYSTGSSWFSGGTTTATTYTIENLEPDTTYYVSIKAIRESANGYKNGRYYTSGHRCYTTSPKIKSTALKSWDTKTNEISLSWDSVSGTCSGYEVYVTNFSGKKIKNEKVSGNGTSFKLASVKNQGFIFKVRAYIDIDGTSIYGNWSASKTVVAQPKVTLKQSGSSTINVSWSKVTGASSYTVYRSTRSGSGFKKIKTTTGTKLTNKGLNEKETYYYYVVANGVKVNKKTYKSTTATYREIAYLAYNGQTSYYH